MRPRRRGLLAAAIGGTLVAVGLYLSPSAATERLVDLLYSPWFPLLLAGLYLVRPALAWPITALSVLVGYRYGLVLGVPIALLGAVATSLVPYAVARRVSTEGGWLGWVASGSERYFEATGDLRGVTAARLAPTPAEAISVAAGTAGVAPAAFVLGTLLGELPWTIAAVLAGHTMRRFSPASAPSDPWLVVGGVLAAALVLAGPAYRYTRGRLAAAE